MGFERVAGYVAILNMVLFCGACGHGGNRQGREYPKQAEVVVSPLSVQVSEPKRLLSVNSLRVDNPSFRGAVHSNLSADRLQSILREVAEETLSLKVMDGGDTSKGSGAGYDSLLITQVITLDDLQGSSIGGEPARVAFKMRVLARGDQRPVWQADYVYRQEAVSDNLLKLGDRLGREGSGAGWISAQEIFKRGVARALEDLNRRRDAQFQSSRNSQ